MLNLNLRSEHPRDRSEGDDGWFLADEDFFGRVEVSFSMLVGGCRVRFLMRTPYCTLDRSGLSMIRMLIALSAPSVFPLRLHASLPRNYHWPFSVMTTNCLGLRPPATMTDGWSPIPPPLSVQDVSSADLCNVFLEHHDGAFLLGAHWRRLLWACVRRPSLRRDQPSTAVPEPRLTRFRAGWLSLGLLRLTRNLAIWCPGWSASSVGETAQGAILLVVFAFFR